CGALAERAGQWQQKALREAKLRSSWTAPDATYEQACESYLQRLLTAREGIALRRALAHAVQLTGCNGALNGLAESMLHWTCRLVPALHQGCDDWDFDMVDPHIRRPVDYHTRMASGSSSPDPTELLRSWTDGRIKQWLIGRVLTTRRQFPELFRRG